MLVENKNATIGGAVVRTFAREGATARYVVGVWTPSR